MDGTAMLMGVGIKVPYVRDSRDTRRACVGVAGRSRLRSKNSVSDRGEFPPTCRDDEVYYRVAPMEAVEAVCQSEKRGVRDAGDVMTPVKWKAWLYRNGCRTFLDIAAITSHVSQGTSF
jgi:hypothetical protein